MSLQRDELAARVLVAIVPDASRGGSHADYAKDAVAFTDALLAALVPVAPASGAPATEPRRTVGAVVDCDGHDYAVVSAGEGSTMRPLEDDKGRPADWLTEPNDKFSRWMTPDECERHGIPYVARPLPGAPLAAATPAAWVPSVGDVVALAPNPFVSATDHRDSYGAHLYRVVRAQVDSDGCAECVRVDGRDTTSPCWISLGAMRPASASERAAAGLPPATYVPTPAKSGAAAYVPQVGDVVRYVTDEPGTRDRVVVGVDALGQMTMRDVLYPESFSYGTDVEKFWRFVRKATASELAAAGLPPAEATRSVDREGMAKVLWEASREVTPAATRARPWGEATEVGRRQSLAAADAAIAFMAKGGAS